MQVTVRHETWPLAQEFRISRGAKTAAEVVVVEIRAGDLLGRGECVPYARYGETVASVLSAIEAVRPQLEAGLSPEALQHLMPPGAARNAVDCALWDFAAKQAQKPVWELAGLPAPTPRLTAFTISLDEPEAMAAAAAAVPDRPLLKCKIGGPGDMPRIEAVAAARPDAALILDANEGLDPDSLTTIARRARALGVELIEQPFRADADTALEGFASPVALCADESLHTRDDIERIARRYDAVNIKLDKAGGFTEALAMALMARDAGLRVMIGCMVGTSLSMAPAALLGSLADWIDLDGPLLLKEDRPEGLRYDGAILHPPDPALWG